MLLLMERMKSEIETIGNTQALPEKMSDTTCEPPWIETIQNGVIEFQKIEPFFKSSL